jgi:hypothetical protein
MMTTGLPTPDPVLSNLYLNEVDRMLERPKRTRVWVSSPISSMQSLPTIW